MKLAFLAFAFVMDERTAAQLASLIGRQKIWSRLANTVQRFTGEKPLLTYGELALRGNIPKSLVSWSGSSEAEGDCEGIIPFDEYPVGPQLTLPAVWRDLLPETRFAIGERVAWDHTLLKWWYLTTWQLLSRFGWGPFEIVDIFLDPTKKHQQCEDGQDNEKEFVVYSRPQPVQTQLVLQTPRGNEVVAPTYCFRPKKKMKKWNELTDLLQEGLKSMEAYLKEAL